MVTTRNTGSNGVLFRADFLSYLVDFGTTITRTRVTDTKDSMNRVTSSTSATVTYKADIQWINKEDLVHLNLGDVKIGDGMIFVQATADVEIHDYITYNSVRWKVISQIEGEQVGGVVVYLAYVIRKIPQS